MKSRFTKFFILLTLLPLSSCAKSQVGSIVFDLHGGTFNSNISQVELESKLKGVSGTKVEVIVPDAVLDGYTFDNWYYNCESSNTSSLCTSVSNKIDFIDNNVTIPYKDVMVHANYKKNSSITFNFNQSYFNQAYEDETYILDGYDTKVIAYNDKPTQTKTEIPNMYLDTSKWYLDRECTKEANLSNFTAENQTVYAKWNYDPTLTILNGNGVQNGQFTNTSDKSIMMYVKKDKFLQYDDLKAYIPTRTTDNGPSMFVGWYYAFPKVNEESKETVFDYTDMEYTFGINNFGINNVTIYPKFRDLKKLTFTHSDNKTTDIFAYEGLTLTESLKYHPQDKIDEVFKNNGYNTFESMSYVLANDDNSTTTHQFIINQTIVDRDLTIGVNYQKAGTVKVKLLLDGQEDTSIKFDSVYVGYANQYVMELNTKWDFVDVKQNYIPTSRDDDNTEIFSIIKKANPTYLVDRYVYDLTYEVKDEANNTTKQVQLEPTQRIEAGRDWVLTLDIRTINKVYIQSPDYDSQNNTGERYELTPNLELWKDEGAVLTYVEMKAYYEAHIDENIKNPVFKLTSGTKTNLLNQKDDKLYAKDVLDGTNDLIITIEDRRFSFDFYLNYQGTISPLFDNKPSDLLENLSTTVDLRSLWSKVDSEVKTKTGKTEYVIQKGLLTDGTPSIDATITNALDKRENVQTFLKEYGTLFGIQDVDQTGTFVLILTVQ